jgi:hypothetical protein
LTKKSAVSQETLTKNLCCKLVLSRNLDKNVFITKKSSIRQGLPVKKKMFLTAGFILMLFLIAIAEAGFVKLAQANPYTRFASKHVSPPEGAIPLIISVSSPKNDAVYNVNDIALAFSVSAHGTDINAINNVSFAASWLQEKVIVYNYNYSKNPISQDFWSYNETFWDMPDGEYSVVITTVGGGYYIEGVAYSDGTFYHFDMTTISVVNFTIATPPEVSILSPKNETYGSSEVPLKFAVDKSFSKISYVLDYQDNMTINGNATLTGLSNGVHNVTVYAWDDAGNIGSSETIIFIVDAPEPFPATFVSTVSVASVATVGAGLLLYRKKRRREAEQT